MAEPASEPLTVFISYAHADEAYKDRLLSHLKTLQRQKLIKAWEDRQIDGGNDWRTDIEQAMDQCQLALLLVSDAFLASDFIQSMEMVRLLARRKSDGVRVVPIIVRPCVWHLDDIGKVQALPKDGKAIVTFPEQNGERDEAWATIVLKIAGWAKDFIQCGNAKLPDPLPAPIPVTVNNGTAQVAHPTTANPFNPWQSPKPSHFFGREDLLRQLHLALDDKRSVSLVGDWRIGKSSLLNIWKTKAEAMGRVVSLRSGEGPEAVSCGAFVRAITAANIAGDDPDIAADALTAWAGQCGGLPPLVLIDEADAILLRLPHRFFERMRGLIGQQKLCLVLASRREVDQIYQDVGGTSPFMNLLEMRRVGLLTADAAEKVIDLGTPLLDERCRALMRHWAGRHPYFLVLLGHFLWDACQNGGDIDAALDEFNDQAAARLRELWKTIDDEERIALYMVLDGQNAQKPSVKRRGLVASDNQGDKIFGEVLATWLTNQR